MSFFCRLRRAGAYPIHATAKRIHRRADDTFDGMSRQQAAMIGLLSDSGQGIGCGLGRQIASVPFEGDQAHRENIYVSGPTRVRSHEELGGEAALSLRVRIHDHAQPAGRVSILAASVIIRAIQAIRAESTSIRVKRTGRAPKLVRESSGLSLIAIEQGSGVMVWESDTISLIDLPSQVFEDFVDKSARSAEYSGNNIGIQEALLLLEPLFRDGSSIRSVEFVDGRSRVGADVALW